MTAPERPTLGELRGIDLFDELDDGQLALWQNVAVIRERPPDAVLAGAHAPDAGVFLLLKGVVQGLIFEAGRLEQVARQVAPTWMGAITTMTETGFAGRDAHRDRGSGGGDRTGGLHAAGAEPTLGPPQGDAGGPDRLHPDRGARAESRAAGIARYDGGRARARAEQPRCCGPPCSL